MSEPSLQSKKPWRAVLARRRWRSGYNAGGSPSKYTISHNFFKNKFSVGQKIKKVQGKKTREIT